MEDLKGRQFGSYRIIAPLGKGGMATVYKAYQASVDRYVAMKILPRYFADQEDFLERFGLEAKVIASLEHPHILPVHDFGEADGYTYLVMRLVEGGSLVDWIREHAPLSLGEICRIIGQVGRALEYAHRRGVIHRDLKPGNVLVDDMGNCLLSDFGLAKIMSTNSNLTQTGALLGTPTYMSPEQGLGMPLDGRSDIYSLGVILYRMAVGQAPYNADTPMATVLKHINDPLPVPSQIARDLPDPVEKVILKAMAKEADDRFESALALVEALEKAVKGKEDEVSLKPVVPRMASAPEMVPADELISGFFAEQGDADAETVAEPRANQSDETMTMAPSGKQQPSAKRGRRFGALLLAGLALLVFWWSGGSQLLHDQDSETHEELEEDQLPDGTGLSALLDQVDSAFEQDDFSGAQEALDRIIEQAPGRAESYCQRGWALREQGELEAAVADFEECGRLAREQFLPELAAEAIGSGASTRAQSAMQEGEPRQAVAHIADALEDEAAPDWLRCEKGQLNMEAGELAAAMADFLACQEGDLDEFWQQRAKGATYEIQARLALENNDFEGAASHFNQWSQAEPDSPEPYCSQGELSMEGQRFSSAWDFFEKCRSRAPDEETRVRARVGMSLAMAQEAREQGDFHGARQGYDQAIELVGDREPWLFCERGELFMGNRAGREAHQDFTTCLELGQDDPGLSTWAREALAELKRRRRLHDQ